LPSKLVELPTFLLLLLCFILFLSPADARKIFRSLRCQLLSASQPFTNRRRLPPEFRSRRNRVSAGFGVVRKRRSG
ncbi:unnamed protein product, partial [Musa hybrid cultivar]